MRVVLSVKKPRTFALDVASRRGEAVVKAADANDDWGCEVRISADKIAKSGVRGNSKELYRICKNEDKAVPAFVL